MPASAMHGQAADLANQKLAAAAPGRVKRLRPEYANFLLSPPVAIKDCKIGNKETPVKTVELNLSVNPCHSGGRIILYFPTK